jgi:GMP synthase-like glutamine amidotransferase
LDGQVTANEVKEIGWLEVNKTQNSAAEDWLAGLPEKFLAFHWHGETFSIPRGANNILRSDHCAHQAFVMDNILAMQCHIEMQTEMIGQWAELYAHELTAPHQTVQSAGEMCRELDQRVQALQSIATPIYERWLRPLLNGNQ